MFSNPTKEFLVLALLLWLAAKPPAAQAQAQAQAVTARAAHTTPALRSHSVFVLDEATSAVLLSRQSDVPRPIASITKLMTALVVLDAHQSPEELLEITQDDRYDAKSGSSRLAIGAVLSRADLMHLALMASENRAAHALGRNYPGGLAACIAAMNAKAQFLGMTSTRFVDPTGLSSENVASSQDLAKLVLAASERQPIQEYSTDSHYTVPVLRRNVEYHNTDALVNNPAWNIIVQKTGYIAEAGRCLVMKALVDGRSVIIVLLDSAGTQTRVADAGRIRRWMVARIATSTRAAITQRVQRLPT